MPVNYGDEHSLKQYISTASAIQAVYTDTSAVNILVAGD